MSVQAKISVAVLAALLPFAVVARGQSGDGKTQDAGVVRQRRVSAKTAETPAGKTEPAAKSGAASANEGRAEAGAVVGGEDGKDAEPVVISEATEPSDEAGIETLRARIGAEQTDAERARLRRELVGRLLELDQRAEAVAELRVMMSEERFDPPYFFNAGNALARLGETGAAVEAYRKAISQRRGNYARAQHNLGVVLVRLGRWEEAEEALKAALRLENFRYAEASYNLGRLYALRGEADLAMEEWARGLKWKPDHTETCVALARALAEDGDSVRALAMLDAFAERMGRRGLVVPREVEVARGEIVAASHVVADEKVRPAPAASSEESAPASLRASPGRGRRDRDERASAARPLRSLVVDQQTYELLRRARAARGAERHEEAVTLYRRVLEQSGGYFPPANVELAYALAALTRTEEAIASMLPVTTKEGERYPVAFYHLGRYYERLGRLSEAGDAFARAAALLSDAQPQFLTDLSRVREKEGRPREALEAIEAYVRAMETLGGAPEWARERLDQLRRKVEAATGPVK